MKQKGFTTICHSERSAGERKRPAEGIESQRDTSGLYPQYDRSGFTLAEMMVVLLILSIVIAAFAPVMTQRMRSGSGSSSSLWEHNNSGIYYNIGDAESVMIGVNAKTTENARVIIKKKTAENVPIILIDENGVQTQINFTSPMITIGTETQTVQVPALQIGTVTLTEAQLQHIKTNISGGPLIP